MQSTAANMPPNMDSDTSRKPTPPSSDTPHKPTPLTARTEAQSTPPKQQEIVWINVIFIFLLHVMAVYGFILLPRLKFLTIIWIIFCHFFGGAGVTIGAHRLWAHRCFKATWFYRLMLMIGNCMAAQNDILEWARDHRVHHKFSETDADPHDARRGFFFSHVGWLMQRKHPDVIKKGKGLDLSDLYADEIVMFQRKYYKSLSMFFCVFVPTLVPYLWGESLWLSYFTAFAFRYVFNLNVTWTVNSFAHLFGNKPYDKTINPSENMLVVWLTTGEGYHNYHHTFPQDYSASEFPFWNFSTFLINCAARLGWAYDLKKIPKDVIVQRMLRTGKLSEKHSKFDPDGEPNQSKVKDN